MIPRTALLFLAAVAAAGCAGYGAALKPGQSVRADVERDMGAPTLVRELPGGESVLWYSKLPFGRESYAARIDADGRLIAVEQRLSPEFIQRVVPGKTSADEVLDLLGPPYRRTAMPRTKRDVWEYPLRTPPEQQTLFVEISPAGLVEARYLLHDFGRCPGFFGGFFFGC